MAREKEWSVEQNGVMPRLSVQYFLNDTLETAEVERQVALMAEASIESILLHPRAGLKTPWLSRKWEEIVRTIYRKAADCGLGIAIWDEYPYPSGNAGGLLVSENPELAGRHLEFFVMPIAACRQLYQFKGAEEEPGRFLGGYIVHDGRILDCSADCGLVDLNEDTLRRIQKIDYQPAIHPNQYPHWRWAPASHCHAMHIDDPESFSGGLAVGVLEFKNRRKLYGWQSDLLNRRTLEAFVARVHDYYHDLAVKEGNPPAFAFTDEPAPQGHYPWTPAFFEVFLNEHGYDLKALLPHLAMDIGQAGAAVRIDYRKTLARLFAENYLGTIGDWCRSHGVRFGGHLPRHEMIGECVNFPYKFRACSFMDIPTHDPLGDNISRKDLVLRTLALKIVASAARVFGKPDVLSDAFALLPDSVSLREIKNSADWQMFAGVNCFAIHNFSYSIAGARKDEAPPTYFYQQPWFPMMKALTDYIKDTCAYLQGASFCADTAVLLPDTTVNASSADIPDHQQRRLRVSQAYIETGQALLGAHAAFEFLDEEALRQGIAADGSLQIAAFHFRRILLPELDFIEAGTALQLEKAAATGVGIIAVGARPRLICNDGSISDWDASGIVLCDTRDIGRLPFDRLHISGDGVENIWMSRFFKNGCEGAYLYNSAGRLFDGLIKGELPVRLYPRTGLLLTEIDAGKARPTPIRAHFEGACSQQIIDRFRISFPENQCPLYIWQAISRRELESGGLWETAPALNLMEDRSVDRLTEDTLFYSRFLTGGVMDDLRLVTEPLEDGRLPEFWWDDYHLKGFTQTSDYDFLHYSLPIPRECFNDEVPQLHILRVEVPHGSFGLADSPLLAGSFEVAMRHPLPGMPQLNPHDGCYPGAMPVAWSSLGRMFYSGSALYAFDIEVDEAQSGLECLLSLGQVEAVAEVRLNGRKKGILFSRPYDLALGRLPVGIHRVEIRVVNTLANRLRSQWRQSGLLSEVRVEFN